ncbi:UDP-N-acetylglucosamine 2-epimerase (hydrolyzing) [Bradyrhizobium sp. 200]|uniref:UDP-N-acetylglucosamine 2-epimerase n=1 Tax=Bradyrhizobium sp. 200 TaxID=2782665 RepID=UPI001FFEA79B|nr:UDP-N-acetylglucosamine 2-epimerase [Bradyrhizobium sp. 200]UPJ51960.1 UDP-N-acetylglucosamine 2-epimerase (hydrolyzing) [Bradyrhizobium sp. 200]
MARRICVITGSRAEYGLLFWLLTDLQADPAFDLQLVVTGMHLAPEFGNTVQEIENDGFSISSRVEMLLSGGTPAAIAKSVGLGVIGMSDALERLRPDIVVLLGDRFEIFAAAQACMIHNIPIAHIAGGDTSEGASDEAMRHAITKMAHLHFATNEQSAARIRQLGENPARVFDVGSPGLDHLRRRPLLDRTALEQALEDSLGAQNLLVTFHPVTLHEDSGLAEFDELLAALEQLDPSIKLWFSLPNADAGGRAMSSKLLAWVEFHKSRARAYASLGPLRYLSLMANVDAVVGNSSSGLYEAPSLGVPTVDIGDRQSGRLAAASVLHCAAERGAILQAVNRAMALDCRGTVSPYGDGRATDRIIEVLRSMPDRAELLRKSFHMTGSERV